MKRVNEFEVIAKPSCNCNLDCRYCYDKTNKYTHKNKVISDTDLRKIIKLVSDYSSDVHWLWHGGEPTTINPKWYYAVQDHFCENYTTRFYQNMQSNGVNFIKNPKWFNVLSDNQISIGISYDILSQQFRIPESLNITEDDYIKLFKELLDRNLTQTLCIICVVHKYNIHMLTDVYEYLKEKLSDYSFYINFRFLMGHKQYDLNLSINDIEKYYRDFVNHNFFDTSTTVCYEMDSFRWLYTLLTGTSNGCINSDCKYSHLGFHPDGEILYCDTYYERFPIGNIKNYNSIEEIFSSKPYTDICTQIDERINNECLKCSIYELCKGWCNHEHLTLDGYLNKCNLVLCEQLKLRAWIVYDSLQNISNPSKLNNVLANFLKHIKGLLPKEVEYFLKLKGYTLDITTASKDFTKTPQYTLFRLFNGLPGLQALPLFSKERYGFFEITFNKNKELINKLVVQMKGDIPND